MLFWCVSGVERSISPKHTHSSVAGKHNRLDLWWFCHEFFGCFVNWIQDQVMILHSDVNLSEQYRDVYIRFC